MLYEIDGKFYILASGKYREIKIEKDSNDGYDVKLIESGKIIEKTSIDKEKVHHISLEEAYKKKFKTKNID